MTPKISIIVPVYNTERYLAQCINSLVNQTVIDIEIICVNDGSSDRSLMLLQEYKEEDDRIIIIDQENQGLSGARNNGVKKANGSYIMFVDSDDWLESNACELLLAKAEQEDADVVACAYVKEFIDHACISQLWSHEFTVDSQQIIRRLFGPINEELSRPQDVDLPVSACMQIIKAEYAKAVDFVDTKKIGTEDLLFQIMTYSKTGKYSYISSPLYHYRRSDYGTLTTKYMAEKYERWQCLYDKLFEMADNYDVTYTKALYNRIAFSLIGLGLNEVLSPEKYIAKANRIGFFLKTDRYRYALSQLNINYLPIHWKLFFFLCKKHYTICLVWLLQTMEFLRKRVK